MAVVGRTHKPVVDVELCQRCGICLRRCPAETMPELCTETDTVRGCLYSGADLRSLDALPPCEAACPVGQQIREYVHLLHEGRPKDAALVIRQDNPLPAVCAYVCHHPCEGACLRAIMDEAVAIRELKRFAVHYEFTHRGEIEAELRTRKPPPINKQVTIIGAGPAGLACGYELVLEGYEVKVVDRLEHPGGMLVGGIPSFRLPRWVVSHDVGILKALGVRFVNRLQVGVDTTLEELKQDSDALVVATGAWQDVTLGIPGEDAEGFMGCLDFLGRINRGEAPPISGRVLVIGGGNAAVDTARSALRLGPSHVKMVYRRSRAEMPVGADELRAAEREGIEIEYLASPRRILVKEGRVSGVELTRMEPGPEEADGRCRPIPASGTEWTAPADLIIPAIGQKPDCAFLGEAPAAGPENIRVGPLGQIRGYHGVFAAGDAVSGASTVVQALASGKTAARQVMAFLQGEMESC